MSTGFEDVRSYASYEDFTKLVPDAVNWTNAAALLNRACDEVDALCYGRIRKRGFENLTVFQQEKVRKAVCYHAAFLYAYGEELESPLSSYGINGVSMSFSADRAVSQGGVTTTNAVMTQLRQSGLAVRLIC